MKVQALAAAAILALAGSAAHAATVLSDNFNADAATLNWAGDAVFTSTSPAGNAPGAGSVDLIGNGLYDLVAGHGLYVDLDGTSGTGNLPDAGQLTSNTIFGAGTYTLSFDLAGNQRGAVDQTTVVTLGSTTIASLTEASADPFATYTYTFTTTGGALQFTEKGPSDQQGNLLDNVTLATATPEPSTWALMLGAIGLAGGALRLGRRRGLAVA